MIDLTTQLRMVRLLSETFRNLLAFTPFVAKVKDVTLAELIENLRQNSVVLEMEIDRLTNGHSLTPQFAELLVQSASLTARLKAELRTRWPELKDFDDEPQNIQQMAWMVLCASEVVFSIAHSKMRLDAEAVGDLFTRMLVGGRLHMNHPLTIH